MNNFQNGFLMGGIAGGMIGCLIANNSELDSSETTAVVIAGITTGAVIGGGIGALVDINKYESNNDIYVINYNYDDMDGQPIDLESID